ncbi:glycosyltransferase [Chloroflexota bacterium]
MDVNENSSFYDAYYFAHCCGRPYKRDEEWMQFFGSIAERIVSDIQPQSVLDAGCGFGFLVEELRKREVKAFGVDLSEFAIQNVHPDFKEYCWQGSILDPFPQEYDLIICVEVLEHMTLPEAERVIENLCLYSKDVLFSSSPFDYKESTHFNVQPPEYWAELFARYGFYRDVDFDANFITAWAARFHRKADPIHRIVRNYERKYWLLWKENSDLREFNLEMRNELSSNDNKIIELNTQARAIQTKLDEQTQSLETALDGQATFHRIELAEQAEAFESQIHEQAIILQTQYEEKTHIFQARLEELEQTNKDTLEKQAQKYQTQLLEQSHEYQSQLAELEHQKLLAENILAQVLESRSWRFMQIFQNIRLFFIPKDSSREKMISNFFRLGSPSKIEEKVSQENVLAPQVDSYKNWIRNYEPTPNELHDQLRTARTLSIKPLISILSPVYNPPVQVLRETIESVLAQTYENWELCVVNGDAENQEIKETLTEFSNTDERIRILNLDQNLGISDNTNEAIKMAKGEFVALLDHDDQLSSEALYQVVLRLNEVPATDIFYFDEDKLSEDGFERKDPFFKPDWSPELLLSSNYLTHMIVRRSILNQVGKLNPEMDGTQDWDLAFRCIEHTNNIQHIPRVLYHWRQISGSAAADFSAKPWVFERQIRAVQEHLTRSGIPDANAHFSKLGTVRVNWPTKGSSVSIIIPSKDNLEYLKGCLTSILQYTNYQNLEVIIVDNQSENTDTLEYYKNIKEDKRVKIINYPETFNYSTANNLGAKHSTSDLLLFLNNDTEATDADWLEEMVRWAEQPDVGVVGAKLLYPNLTIQHAGVVIGMEGHASHVFWSVPEDFNGIFGSVNWYRNYSAVTGACMMIPRDLFKQIGGFDENYILTFSDVEICLRIMDLGYRIVYTPFAQLIHFEGKSRGNYIPANDIIVGYDHMGNAINRGDPYYNPNLSYRTRIPSLKSPGEESRKERIERIINTTT